LSGKIESIDSDSAIHNLTTADDKADLLLAEYEDEEETLTLECHDLVASRLYASWPFNETDKGIVGSYIVTERTISQYGPEDILISVTLKNRNFFARYGYKLNKAAEVARNAYDTLAEIGSRANIANRETFLNEVICVERRY